MVIGAELKTAYFYGRVSTDAQAGATHSSLEIQEARALAHCGTHHLNLIASFNDVQSGKRNNRTEYRRMVEAALDGGVDVIVVQWLDHFGRNPREILS